MPRTHFWKVPEATFEYLSYLAEQQQRGLISESDYLEKLRLAGMPDAVPGDDIRIQLVRPAHSQVPRIWNGKRMLPGLPN